jgi:hypothetical protein
MAINQKDIKLLWGRSANRCAICKIELAQDSSAHNAAFTLGEMAHVVGEKEGAARGNSILTTLERNGYHNLILLCPNHHTIIDGNEKDWPIEKLHLIKSEHELWVRETLSSSSDLQLQANKLVVTNIIDTTVKVCKFEQWREWTSWALSTDPYWEADLGYQLFYYLQKVKAAIWPQGFTELKNATETLAIILHRASEKFLEHSQRDGEYLRSIRFYRGNGFNENYDRDVDRYEQWLSECYHLIREATKAANWFAEVVRRDINPMFFAESGKFVIIEGPYEDLKYYFRIPEFNETEKQSLPKSLFESHQP